MLNIYYSLKTINFLKIKSVVLKLSVPIGIPKSADLKCTPCFKIIHKIINELTCENSIEKFLQSKVIWCNINSPFGLNTTCSINTVLNPYTHNLSIKTIVELILRTNEITYKEKTLKKTLSMFTVSETNFRRAFEKSSKYFISHVPQ